MPMVPYRVGCDGERLSVAEPSALERHTERDRADELPLHRLSVETHLAGEFEERPHPGEGIVAELGPDRRIVGDPRRVDRDAAVVAERDAGKADDRLCDQRFGG